MHKPMSMGMDAQAKHESRADDGDPDAHNCTPTHFRRLRGSGDNLRGTLAASRRPNDTDEERSFSSMSSTSRAKSCSRCHKEAEGVTKPLIMCRGCKRRWHPFCNNKIEARFGAAVSPDWLCDRCENKQNSAAPNSTTSPAVATKATRQPHAISLRNTLTPKSSPLDPGVSRPRLNSLASHSSNLFCAKIGCGNPISTHIGLDNWKTGTQVNDLCKQHEMEEKHRRASTARPDLKHNAGSNPIKPINKKKLYPKPAPDRQIDMLDEDFEVGAYENQQNVQTRLRGSRSKSGLRNSNFSPTKAGTNVAADDRAEDVEMSDVVEHISQIDVSPGVNVAHKSIGLPIQSDPTETPPRPKLDLPKWQLELIAKNAAKTNASVENADDYEDERLVPSTGSPDYEPMLPSNSPTVAPSVGDRDDDHYSPGLQLESEIGAFAQTSDQASSVLSSLSSTPLRQTPEFPHPQIALNDVQKMPTSVNDPKAINSILDGSPANETERYKQRHLRVIMGVWGDDFVTKLPAWPEVPGKTFLEFLIKICRTEKVSLQDFAEGIAVAYHERTAGKDNIKGHERYIKISDVKVFLARYHSTQQSSTEQYHSHTTSQSQRRTSHGYQFAADGNTTEELPCPVMTLSALDASRAKMPEVVGRYSQPGFTEPTKQATTDLPTVPQRDSSRAKMPEGAKRNSNIVIETHADNDYSARTQDASRRGQGKGVRTLDAPMVSKETRSDNKPDNYVESSTLAAAADEIVDSRGGNTSGRRKESSEATANQTSKQKQQKGRPISNFGVMFDTQYNKPTENLEIKRQIKAAQFDESTLDNFLYRSKSEDKGPDPEAWGHIDPREAWPRDPVLTPEFLEAKQAEIAARGNRKSASRFGKHLTPEVVQYRKQMGWQKHQNREVKKVDTTDGNPLQDLFGVPHPDTMEPISKDGKLWMQEIGAADDGEQQNQDNANKKLKAWPVLSAN